MAEALYRKYRPQVFSDVVGQEHIERTIKNAIEQDKVSHAYLFTGPRGTGKTTTARLLAKALLCENGPTSTPDGTCQNCQEIAEGIHPDVYELDAASRTGVDNVREEIIGRVNYAPTRGRWKIYIIDEAHMLTPAAFNALLKTLEEPPSHVVFIMCTTDPQRIPDTVHSRCQRFDFHRLSIESMVARLGMVCASENVEFEAEALELIARRAEGGMRNALTSLEQLIAFGEGKVTLETAERLLGSLDSDEMDEIVTAIGRRDAAACFNWTNAYVETGADLAQFARDLAEHVRDLYIFTLTKGQQGILDGYEASRASFEAEAALFGPDRLSRLLVVLGDLSRELRTSTNPRLSFEIALTRMVRPESDLTLEALAERVEELERRLDGTSSIAAAPMPAAVPAVAAAPMAAARPAPAAVQGAAAAQRPSAPAAAPAAASTPAPAPAAAQAAPAPSQAQPAPVAAQGASTVQPAPQAASVDLSSPAAVQRFWHATTMALRKANPARGVLFMNARASANPQGGLLIEFTKDNDFAYRAALKAEVRQLLSQTLAQVAGGPVPFELREQEGAAAPAPAATPAAQRSAVRQPAASAPAVASVAASAVAPAAAAPVSVPATPTAAAPAIPATPAAPAAAASPAVPAPDYDDDRPPLDVYDAYAASYDEAEDQYAPAPPVPENAPSAQGPASTAPSRSTAGPAAARQAAAPSASVPAQSASAPSDSASSEDERTRIEQALSEAFGQDIKFEDVDG